MDIIFLVAPIFLLIILGNVIRRTLIQNMSFWDSSSKLVYWVLMPAMFFYQMSSTQINLATINKYAIVLLVGFFGTIVVTLVVSYIFKFKPKVITSVLQGAVRNNLFIAFAIVGKIFGDDGIVLASLAMAILIPISNITIVGIMVILLNDKGDRSILVVLKKLLTNPLLIAIILGGVFSVYGWQNIPILHDFTKLLGSAALPIVLITIGASIEIREISVAMKPIFISVISKMVVFPVIVFVIARYLELTDMQTIVLVIFAAVPTAVSSFALAKEMGGATKLMNSIITVQTLISFVTIPITLKILS